MSIVQRSLSWVKQTFTFSTSRESWRERIVVAAILLSGLGLTLWCARHDYELITNLIVSLVFLAAAAVVCWVSGINVFGPVLIYDMIRTSRRNRYFLIRFAYAVFLLLVLAFTWSSTSWRNMTDRQQASEIAMSYFGWFTVVQFIAVLILAPAYVAGSISEEKDRKTLEFLLATDLRNREIVLSKLGSRLSNLFLFLLTGLPILSCLQFLGGVDPDLVLVSFAATGITAFGIASMSALNSVFYKRPRDSIAMSYLMVLAYYIISTTLWGLKFSGHWFFQIPVWFDESYNVGWLVDGFSRGNVITGIEAVSRAGRSGSLATLLPPLLGDYAVFYGIVSLVCIVWAVVRLRTIALRQQYGRVQKLRWYQRYRAPVGELPMLWKELNVEGSLRVNWVGWIAMMLLVILTVGIGLLLIGNFFWQFLFNPNGFNRDVAEGMNIWVRLTGTGVACLTLLGVAVRASTTIRSEIDRDTFDALITTPLSSDAILLSKFVGALFSVRLGWLWLGAVLALGVLTGGMHVVALPLFLGAWFVYACFFGMIGLWYSMVAKSMMRATVYTMLTTVGLAVGHWLVTLMCCLPTFFLLNVHRAGDLPEYMVKFQAGMTPPFVLFLFAYPAWDPSFTFGPRDFGEMVGFSLLGLFLWTMACLMLWFVLIAPRFRQMAKRDQTSTGEE
jgi:ABC-type transport system involved in multi-copper enzyme maturation permease subunit